VHKTSDFGGRNSHSYYASHKSNPSSVLRGIVDAYSTLPWVTWEAVTGVEGVTCWGCYDTRWLTGLWSTQAKVEGIVSRAAWHWGRKSSVVNDPLAEPGCAPLYVGLPSAWGSVDGDLMFSPYVGGLLIGDSGRHTWMNE